MDLGIAGKVALVTGASKGIGRGIAAELAAEGVRVAISSSSPERVAATAAELDVLGVVHDSADLDGAPGLLETVERSLGPIDILVCNTGGPPSGDPLGFTRKQWEAAYRTLVLAQIALVEGSLAGMRERGWGRIVSVASTSVREPLPHLILSNAHRASLVAAFKTLARAVAADGVTLNTVLPGRIGTERLTGLYGSLDAAVADGEVPAGRVGTVEDLAAAAAFLCSERAGYVTGETLAVDGGLTRST